jgi:hypothetical protein
MNGFDDALKPPTKSTSKPTATMLMTTLTTMERREEARQHDKQRQ